MAGSTAFERGRAITGINITPLVDVVLVLLVVLMVTATYVVSSAIPLDLPRAASGEPSTTMLAVSVDDQGRLFLDSSPVTENELREAVRTSGQTGEPRVMIAADGATAHRRVVRVLDLLRQEGVRHFAVNVQPPAQEDAP